MALSYEVDRFSKLSGEDWKHTSIGRIGAFLDGYTTALGSIEDEPVIRCKDCINFTRGKDEWGSCFENPMKMWRETDFCSRGERKDDERLD